jgi:endonuclease IV
MIYSKSTLDKVLDNLRSLGMDSLEAQLAYQQEALSKTSEARDQAILRENIRLIRMVIAEKTGGEE